MDLVINDATCSDCGLPMASCQCQQRSNNRRAVKPDALLHREYVAVHNARDDLLLPSYGEMDEPCEDCPEYNVVNNDLEALVTEDVDWVANSVFAPKAETTTPRNSAVDDDMLVPID